MTASSRIVVGVVAVAVACGMAGCESDAVDREPSEEASEERDGTRTVRDRERTRSVYELPREESPTVEEIRAEYSKREIVSLGLPEPEEGGASAVFWTPDWDAGRLSPMPIIVESGGEETVVEPDRRGRFVVGADARELQRIEIVGETLLMRIEPGATYRLESGRCPGRAIDGPGLDFFEVDEPEATCIARSQDCPDDMERVSEFGRSIDPLCSAELLREGNWKRCVREATVEISADGSAEVRGSGLDGDGPVEGTKTVAVSPGVCPVPKVVTDTEEVGLIFEVGARWRLEVDEEGRVSGRRR